MTNSKFHSFPFHSFPKENSMGTGGMNEIFMSIPTVSLVPGTSGNVWERVGTGELATKPRKGMFFHWYSPEGAIEHQGHLLKLSANGYGVAQLFEWLMGEPSKTIKVSPDYLRSCIFYTSCTAMNDAYEREVSHD